MTIRSDEAAAMLADVDSVVAKVKQSRIYRSAALIIILWGVVDLVRDALIAVAPAWFGPRWFFVDALGVVGTIAILRRAAVAGARLPLRMLAAFALVLRLRLDLGEPSRAASVRASRWRSGRRCSCSAMRSRAYGSARRFRRSASASRRSSSPATSGQAMRFRCGMALVTGVGFILCGLWMRRA